MTDLTVEDLAPTAKETDTRPLFRRNETDVTDPLTDDEVRNWVAVLRSGDYLQAMGQLQVRTQKEMEDTGSETCGHCCLGVLATEQDLFKKHLSLEPSAGTLSVVMYQPEPNRLKTTYLSINGILQEKLAELNDNGTTFSEIAEVIETGYLKSFEGEDIPASLVDMGFDHEWAYDNQYLPIPDYDYNENEFY